MARTRKILINDKLQTGFYFLTENIGESFHPDFNPELTPSEMLTLGIFGGKYMTDCQNEFPKSWFKDAKFAKHLKDPKLNYFGIDASLSLSEWERRGWIHPADPRGWFQWYCRYYYGRRIEDEDHRQIKRWKAMKRHVSAIEKNCPPLKLECRPKQRQALLHWAYDSRNI